MMSSVKKLCISAFCLALCCVLPTAFHAVGLGQAFSPMHFPVLLCGLVCGWPYGLVCGFAGPLLAHAVTSAPAAAQLLPMVSELCVYGLSAGAVYRYLRTGRPTLDLYAALLPAMLAGRMIGGAVRALVFLGNGQPYSLAMWGAAYFAGTLPGMIAQLILLPVLVLTLTRAGLIPPRYPAQALGKTA